MIQTGRNFFRAGTAESSKRLLSILSYLVSLGLAIFCVVHGVPLDGNVLILLLGLSGVSTFQQIVGNKNEIKKEIVDVEQPQD